MYDFDVSTGILTFDQQLSKFATWGAQFSPNSDVLYASEQPPAICRTYGDIIQYDLNSLDIIGSRNIVAHGFRYRSMQEGPDGRIYVWRTDNPAVNPEATDLSVINFPDVLNINNNKAVYVSNANIQK